MSQFQYREVCLRLRHCDDLVERLDISSSTPWCDANEFAATFNGLSGSLLLLGRDALPAGVRDIRGLIIGGDCAYTFVYVPDDAYQDVFYVGLDPLADQNASADLSSDLGWLLN